MSETIRILYVDDNPHDRTLVRDALEAAGGFRVAEAASREAFEARLEERDYDLVLSDFNILGFSGLDVIDVVQASDPELPIVIVTGTGSEEVAVKAMRRGVADYVIKTPAHIRRLPHTIRAVLEKRQLQREREKAGRALEQAYQEAIRKQEVMLSLSEDLRGEVEERRRAQAEMRRLVHELEFLSRSATHLIALETEEEIYAYLGEHLEALLEDAVVIVNRNEPASGQMMIAGVYGLGGPLLREAVEILDGSPVGQGYAMHADAQRLFETGELEVFPGGLPQLGQGYVPRPVLETLQERLDIERVYLIGLAREGELYAGVQIYTRRESVIKRPDLVETFIRQVSIALQRRRAERRRRESEERFRRLVESSDDHIFLLESDGTYLMSNDRVGRFGLKSGEALEGRHLRDVYPPEVADFYEQQLEQVLAEGKPVTFEHAMPEPDGARHHVDTLYPVRYLGGDWAVGGICRDITERRRAEEEVRRRAEQLRAISELSVDLLSARSADDALQLVAKRLKALTGAVGVNVSAYDAEDRQLVVEHVAAEEDLIARANELLERRIVGMRMPVSDADYGRMTKEIVATASSLHETTFGTVSEAAAETVQRTLGIDQFVGLALAEGDDLLGTSVLALGADQAAPADEVLRLFGRVVASSLRQRKTEEALHRVSEERRTILDLVPIGISITDHEGQILAANRMSEELLGISVDEHKERRFDGEAWDIIRPDGTPMPAEEYASVRALEEQRTIHNVEMGIVKSMGEVTWISVSATPVPLEGYGVAIAYADITERKRAEEALQARVAELRLLSQVGSEIAGELALDAVLTSAATWVQESFGYYQVVILEVDPEAVELVVRAASGGFTERIPEGYRQGLDEGITGWAASHGETVLVNDVESDPRYLNRYPDEILTKSELSVPILIGGDVIGVIDLQSEERDAFDEDDVVVTETLADQIAVAMKNARLYEAERKARRQLRDLASYLQDARERERKQLARELHDELGQALTAIAYELATVGEQLSDQPPSAIEKRVRDARALVREMDDKVSEMALDLRPSMLDDLGLIPALRWYVGRYATRRDVDVSLKITDLETRLSPTLETALYRTVQEALTNVAKHADASSVQVELRQEASGIVALIEDDGRGFDVAETVRPFDRPGLGLLGMEERITSLGGTLDVDSRPGEGTRLTIRIPM